MRPDRILEATETRLIPRLFSHMVLVPFCLSRPTAATVTWLWGLRAAMIQRAVLAGTSVPVGSTAPGEQPDKEQRVLVLRAIVLRGGLEVKSYCPLR